jgi:hypothetical protein
MGLLIVLQFFSVLLFLSLERKYCSRRPGLSQIPAMEVLLSEAKVQEIDSGAFCHIKHCLLDWIESQIEGI